jgi:hypothetical protein
MDGYAAGMGVLLTGREQLKARRTGATGIIIVSLTSQWKMRMGETALLLSEPDVLQSRVRVQRNGVDGMLGHPRPHPHEPP